MIKSNMLENSIAPIEFKEKSPDSENVNLSEPKILTNKFNSISQKLIIDTIIASACESTTHGIPHFFKRDRWAIRIVWAVCFLASAVICNFLIAQSIINYFQFNTITKEQLIDVTWTEFPTVSICNLNAYITNASQRFVQQVLAENGLSLENTTTESTLRYLKFIVGQNSFTRNLTDSDRKSFGADLSDMLVSCSYNMKPCSVDDFEWFYDFYFGNCFKFNSGKFSNGSYAPTRTSSKPGMINGLSLELFLYEPKNLTSLTSFTGVHVVVHNKSELPLFNHGITVATGSATNIQVSRVFFTYLEKPYRNCMKNITESYESELVKELLKKGYSYSQHTCFFACYQRTAINLCGCYSAYIQALTGTPDVDDTKAKNCRNLTELNCYEDVYDKLISLHIGSECGELCPVECDSVSYNLFAYVADYPSRVYANSALARNPTIQAKYTARTASGNQANSVSEELTYESLKRNMAQVSVYYGELGYEQYNEIPDTTWLDLISNIGGTLGLFLGMSFLSFVEVVDIFMQILLNKSASKKRDEDDDETKQTVI